MKFDHNNISPLDSRYANKISNFRENFSESALIKIRFEIEIEWILFLCNKLPKTFKPLSKNSIEKIINFKNKFDNKSVLQIKKIEATTNHDVKAVEYFIRDYFKKDKVLSSYIHLIHFGLTSEDINSLSYAVMIKKGISLYINEISTLNKVLKSYSKKWANVAFLARTHGQPASPSTLGKEFKVFAARLDREISILKSVKPLAKFSGATGNYHTFAVVDNKIKWSQINKKFIKQFSVDQNPYTTQIEPHDWIAEVCHSLIRINNIMVDLCQDSWIYISNDIFALKLLKNEVGSSTMPHKVNPIDFENAEGNIGVANSIFDFFSNKLTRSRLQRDLSDSTVLRNVGVPFSHTLISFESIIKGLNKIYVNQEKINLDIENNWIVISEAIQTILRREGFEDPYEIMKHLTRKNSKLDKESIHRFIDNLDVNNNIKLELKKITPYNYTGIDYEKN